MRSIKAFSSGDQAGGMTERSLSDALSESGNNIGMLGEIVSHVADSEITLNCWHGEIISQNSGK